MIRVCDPLAFHHPIPPWNTHMSLQLQFFFSVFLWGVSFFNGASLFSWGSPVLASARGLAAVASGVRGWFARPPASHAQSHAPRPTRAGGGSPFLRSVRPFRFRPSFLLPPLKAASLAFVRLARVCLACVCLAVIM